jgi:hypothetical protein
VALITFAPAPRLVVAEPGPHLIPGALEGAALAVRSIAFHAIAFVPIPVVPIPVVCHGHVPPDSAQQLAYSIKNEQVRCHTGSAQAVANQR